MISNSLGKPRRVLIASSHPLFGQGLRSLLQERKETAATVVGMVSTLEQALAAIEKLHPDLVIVDYDDEKLNRDEFLARFVESEATIRVVLLSLQSGKEALVYDRRTLAASQVDNWLDEWTYSATKYSAEKSFATKSAPEDLAGYFAVAQGEIPAAQNRRNTMKHLAIAAVLVVVVTVLLILGLDQVQLLPEQASAQAVPIDNLFNLEFKVIAFLFALIVVLMVYSIVVFRRKKGDTADAVHMEGNQRLEMIWTVAPLLTVLYFAYLGGSALGATLEPAPKPLVVRAVAQQWSWSFEYPDSGIVSPVLWMPVDKQILLELISKDVIHSFWVPEFRVKQDALPGGEDFVRTLRVTATKLGDTYKVRCAELCGTQHSTMEAQVKVVTQEEFDAWVREETGVSDDPVVRGQKWAERAGCIACHSIDGTKIVGPTWKDLYCSQVTLADGSTVVADQEYLFESIRNPAAKVVEGFAPGIMQPNVASGLTDDQVNDIIEYTRSLSTITCP
jgi:cytochrome c oxidase subunit 2